MQLELESNLRSDEEGGLQVKTAFALTMIRPCWRVAKRGFAWILPVIVLLGSAFAERAFAQDAAPSPDSTGVDSTAAHSTGAHPAKADSAPDPAAPAPPSTSDPSSLAGSAETRIVDRLVARVGGEVVLQSEIEDEMLLEATRSSLDLSDPEVVRKAREGALEGLIEARLLLSRAHEENFRATPEEIEESVERMVNELKARFPSEEAFEAQLVRENVTMDGLRETYRRRMRDQLDIGKLIDKHVRTKVQVEDTEIRSYFETHREEIPMIPASLEVRRIRTQVRGASGVDSAAANRARIVRDRLRRGENFSSLATIFSEGVEASKGGDLGWFRRGDLEPGLEAAIESLGPGEVSDVVSSALGTHLFQVESRDGERYRLRQILFKRDDETAKRAARSRIEVASRRVAAGEDFVAVAAELSEEAVEPAERGRTVRIAIDALEPGLRTKLESLQPMQVSEILEDPEGFTLVRVESREGEKAPTFEEIRERLEAVLRQEKSEKLYDEYVNKVRSESVVEVLPEAKS